MLPLEDAGPVVSLPHQSRHARAEAIKHTWRAGADPNAEAALTADPDLALDHMVAVDLAYEEFCLKEERGHPVDDTSSFCGRFPFASSIRRLIAVHGFLDEHPDLFDQLPQVWPEVGMRVGDVLVRRELGRGGFSRVYLGTESSAGDRPVAMKVSAQGNREAATLGPLSHSHLLPVLSSRTVEQWNVVTMPFAGSSTLQDLLARLQASPFPPRSAKPILDAVESARVPDDPPFAATPAWRLSAGQSYLEGVLLLSTALMEAVQYLHEQGVAHRDLKPTNVLLGTGGHPYLLDFNLATRAVDDVHLAGTIPYMAPEQLAFKSKEGISKSFDWRRCDIYAFGVILFELVAGQHPFLTNEQLHGSRGSTLSTVLTRLQREGHPPLNALNPHVRRALREVIHDCLQHSPMSRPTANQVLQRLKKCSSKRSWRRILVPAIVTICALSVPAAVLLPMVVMPDRADSSEGSVKPLNGFERGILLYRQRQNSLAATEFLAHGETKNDAEAYACAAYCLSLDKNFRLAIEAAAAAERLGNRDAGMFANRAYARLQTGNLHEAMTDCTEALRLAPDLPAAVLTRAMLHMQMHQRNGTPIPYKLLNELQRAMNSATSLTADVWLTAAYFYLINPEDTTASKDKAVHAIEEAVRLGKPADAIRRSPIFAPALSGHPGFDPALRTPRDTALPTYNPHLVSPIQ